MFTKCYVFTQFYTSNASIFIATTKSSNNSLNFSLQQAYFDFDCNKLFQNIIIDDL